MNTMELPSEAVESQWRSLQERWVATTAHWRDAVRLDFERQFWQDYERVVPSTIRKLEELEREIANARHAGVLIEY